MSEINNLQGLYRAIDSMGMELPDTIVISGKDLSVFDLTVDHARKHMAKSVAPVEVTVFSGEPGDDLRFHKEVFNIPLFAPYRLIIVRKAPDIFKPALSSTKTMERYASEFARLPDRTWIIIEYEGTPTKGFLNLFGDRLLHYETRELYESQIHETLIASLRKAGLKLDDEALHELQERVDPGAGSVEKSVLRLKDMLAPEKDGHASLEDVREILFPSPGLNPFRFVDALFDLNHGAFRRELRRYNPAVDSLFPVIKLILNRTNEIRKLIIGRKHGMGERELIDLLDLKSRSPGMQKRIISRRGIESGHFTLDRISQVYDLLIDLQHEFRSKVPVGRQMMIFQERILPVFFIR